MTDRPVDGGDDLYSALGVPAGATDEEITRAYRRRAREHHPDVNPEAEADAFAGITDAYDVLRDPGRRRAYDATRQNRARAASAASGFRIPIRHGTTAPTSSQTQPARSTRTSATVEEIDLALSFDQAALGTVAVVPLRLDVRCPDCGGSGAVTAPGASCPACSGAGSTTRTSGGITIRTACPACDGRGRRPPVTCTRCQGVGATTATRDVNVRVPAGVDPGTRLRVRVPDSGSEIVAIVTVAPHPFFGRHGDDLTVRLPVTLAEAALGAVVTIPTLDGAVAIRIPPGTPPGRTMRVRGRGIPRPDHRGDLLVTVDVVVPAELNDAQRAALEAFAVATDSPRAHFEVSSGLEPPAGWSHSTPTPTAGQES